MALGLGWSQCLQDFGGEHHSIYLESLVMPQGYALINLFCVLWESNHKSGKGLVCETDVVIDFTSELLYQHDSNNDIYNDFLILYKNIWQWQLHLLYTSRTVMQAFTCHTTFTNAAYYGVRWSSKIWIFHLILTKIHEILHGERSQASELNKVGIFEIGPVFPKLCAFEILMFFLRIGPKNSWSFAVGTSTHCHSFISEYFHSIFCSKVEGSVLNKTTQSFSLLTFEPWLIVVIRQHVFHVYSSMTIF